MTNTADFFLRSIDTSLVDPYDTACNALLRLELLVPETGPSVAMERRLQVLAEDAAMIGVILLGSRALHEVVLDSSRDVMGHHEGVAEVLLCLGVLHDTGVLDGTPQVRALLG